MNNFNAETYGPPGRIIDVGMPWEPALNNTTNKLLQDLGKYYESPHELYDAVGDLVVGVWQDADQDPNPKHDWESLLRDRLERFWMNDAVTGANHLSSEVYDVSSGDVLIVDRFQKAGTPGRRMPLDEALNTVFDTDAHMIPCVGTDVRPLKSDLFSLSYLVFDMDTPDHTPLCDATTWLEDQVAKIEGHSTLSQYYAFYTTNGGFRVIYKPERFLSKDKFTSMRRFLLHHFKLQGVDVDQACKDFGRLFRLPHVLRDFKQTSSMCDILSNTLPFMELPKVVKNYTLDEDEEGKVKRVPLGVKSVVDQILSLTGGWPKVAGGVLFYKGEDNKPRFYTKYEDLVGWLSTQDIRMEVFGGYNFITKMELFASLPYHCDSFENFNLYPYVPPFEGAYILKPLPFMEDASSTKYLDGLLDFFHADSELDRSLIKAAFVTPMANCGHCPVFTVDSSSGRGAGKTSLVRKIGELYGGTVSFTAKEVRNSGTEFMRKFLYADKITTRVALIDNVVGFFGSDSFAQMITADSISARLPYGAGDVTRKNDLTWFLTSNDANYDKDYISRSLFILLKEHELIANWDNKVDKYINTHKYQILNEIKGLLTNGVTYEVDNLTRFHDWEKEVLFKCVKDAKQLEQMREYVDGSKNSVDADLEFCTEILDILTSALPNVKGNYVFAKRELFQLWSESSYFNRSVGSNTFNSLISEGIKNGSLGRLNKKVSVNGRVHRRGVAAWNWGSEIDPETIELFGGKFIKQVSEK